MNEGREKGLDEMFCGSCGAIIKKSAIICPICGTPQRKVSTNNGVSSSWLTTLLLCWFLGVFGGHRFYTGKTGSAILMALTLGGCGIWWLVDLLTIISGNFTDANGNPITNR